MARKMRTRNEIIEEIKDFVEKAGGIHKATHETMLLEAIFELLLDIRDIQPKPLVATVGGKKHENECRKK